MRGNNWNLLAKMPNLVTKVVADVVITGLKMPAHKATREEHPLSINNQRSVYYLISFNVCVVWVNGPLIWLDQDSQPPFA